MFLAGGRARLPDSVQRYLALQLKFHTDLLMEPESAGDLKQILTFQLRKHFKSHRSSKF